MILDEFWPVEALEFTTTDLSDAGLELGIHPFKALVDVTEQHLQLLHRLRLQTPRSSTADPVTQAARERVFRPSFDNRTTT